MSSPAEAKPAGTAPSLPKTVEDLNLNLRNPILAALLAWLIPGAGHFYQGRHAKGGLFLACILGLYVFGVLLGEGKVVHTGGTSDLVRGKLMSRLVQRWTFFPQACVGVPAIFAVYQHMRVSRHEAPLFAGWFAPPRGIGDLGVGEKSGDELAYWNATLNQRYDMGMLYTMIAGLLNVLAIYDAFSGPVLTDESDDEKTDKKKNGSNDDKKEGS